jgi:hypothetical protein
MGQREYVPPGRTPVAPSPGWYVDPGDPHRLRLWDGHVWTEHVSQMPVSSWSVPIAVHRGPTGHNWGGFGFTAFAGVALLVVAGIIGVVEEASRPGGPGGEEAAVAACRHSVATRLQNPDSARFSSIETTEGAPDYWTVTGAVDSLSAVGLTERIRFTCLVSPDERGQSNLAGLRLNWP